MSDMVREANWLLGVNGKLTMVRDYGSVEWYKPDEWVWHAERGGFPWDGMHKPNSNARMGARTQELEGVDGTEERHGLGADG